MTTTIFDTISQQQADKQRADYLDYVALLARMDVFKPSAADTKELTRLCAVLGKTPQQADKDRQALDLIRLDIGQADGEDKARAALKAAEREHDKVLAERQAAYKQANDAVVMSQGRKGAARACLDLIQQAKQRLKEHDPDVVALLASK